ncbi:MAG: RidA family protein [Acidobacteriota bacterium]
MEIVNPPELGQPKGYNNGIIADGRLLFVAGQVGWNSEQKITSDRFTDQFAQALANILTVVRKAGGDASNIARLLIFVTDKSEYLAEVKEVGAAYRHVMGRHFPAMTLVEVKSLLEERAKVEIEAIAVL